MKPITVKDLKDQIGMDGPRPFLYCASCESEFSANRGDYVNHPSNFVFECCGEPTALVTKHVVYKGAR